MATSPSDRPPRPAFEVVGGGVATPEEVAAIAVALDVLVAAPPQTRPVSRWRWSGRKWGQDRADWRGLSRATHPLRS